MRSGEHYCARIYRPMHYSGSMELGKTLGEARCIGKKLGYWKRFSCSQAVGD
jgi:hypothetical protein